MIIMTIPLVHVPLFFVRGDRALYRYSAMSEIIEYAYRLLY